jgi:glycerol-3-phosphate dehydrogenase
MNVALIMTAVKLGAVVANHCELTSLRKHPVSGKLVGGHVRDNLTGEEWDIRCKVPLRSHPYLNSQDLTQLPS